MLNNSTQALNAVRKTKNNIKQLCEIVNQLDIDNGGNGFKVREGDFTEHLNDIQAFIESK
jgi:hypothetical protein